MKLTILESIDSTNRYLKDKEKKENFEVVIAREQTAGRGRRGNSWLSSEGAGIFSFTIREEKELSDEKQNVLSLVIGMALLKALKEVEELDYKFKWTNDIYIEEKKLSGILIEKVGEFFVVGIGININNRLELPTANSLKSITGKNYDIDSLIIKVVKSSKEYYRRLLNDEWEEINKEINSCNFLFGRRVRVELPNRTVEGLCGEVLEDGRLELITSEGRERLHIGEVHIEL